MTKTASIKLTSAVGIAGVLCRAGEIVTVPEKEAKDLLRRGKGVLATADDEPAGEVEEVEGEDPLPTEAPTAAPTSAPKAPPKQTKK